MAKQSGSYMGGFSGRLGPAVGYQWNGKWCMRALPRRVRNPRTAAQVEHREMFKREVQLAAQMRWAVNRALTPMAREAGMTAYNLFVSLNQGVFGLSDGQFTVDYSRLVLCTGPVAPVAMESIVQEERNVVHLNFEKNPLHLSAGQHDSVYLFAFCPDERRGYLSAPVYRGSKRIDVMLPQGFAGCEVQLFLMVENSRGQWSETVYGGSLTLAATTVGRASTVASAVIAENTGVQTVTLAQEASATGAAAAAAAPVPDGAGTGAEATAAPPPEPTPDSGTPRGGGTQLGLFDF